MTTTQLPKRVSRPTVDRPWPRPRVSTTALLIGYLFALGIVAVLGGLLANYAR